MPIERLAIACRDYMLYHPALRHDLPPTKRFPNHAIAPIEHWSAWWLEWPLSRWMDEQNGHRWFKQEQGLFLAAFTSPKPARLDFELLTSEMVEYRLAQYTATRLENPVSDRDAMVGFTAKVTHSGGRPILMLPRVEEHPGRPFGPVDVKLPDGSTWVFRFVRIACNVAGPKGADANELGELMRDWFGPDAGMPGTGFKVLFQLASEGWSAKPVATPTAKPGEVRKVLDGPDDSKLLDLIQSPAIPERFTRFVPVYTLEAAAGLWGPEAEPEETGWTDVSRFKPRPGMFVVKVRGRSMEPKIPNGINDPGGSAGVRECIQVPVATHAHAPQIKQPGCKALQNATVSGWPRPPSSMA
jgi:hypothetical protein